jgi:hypothetical protein
MWVEKMFLMGRHIKYTCTLKLPYSCAYFLLSFGTTENVGLHVSQVSILKDNLYPQSLGNCFRKQKFQFQVQAENLNTVSVMMRSIFGCGVAHL